MPGALSEQGSERFAVREVDGDEDGAWNVVLIDVELFEQGAEYRAGVKLWFGSRGFVLSHPFP